MSQSRRSFLSGAAVAATLGAPPTALRAAHSEGADLSRKVVAEFGRLPGRKALKLWAPAADGVAEWSAALDPDAALYCGSAFKAFVLAEYLRQAGGGDARHKEGLGEQLDLDEGVFSHSSPVFNPPHLSGKVTTRTVLEAMISHSDKTATDMALWRGRRPRAPVPRGDRPPQRPRPDEHPAVPRLHQRASQVAGDGLAGASRRAASSRTSRRRSRSIRSSRPIAIWNRTSRSARSS